MFGIVVDAKVEVDRSKDGRRDWYALTTKASRQMRATEMSGNIREEGPESGEYDALELEGEKTARVDITL